MTEKPQLSTSCCFKGKQYMLQLTTSPFQFTLMITNKMTMEKWKNTSTVEYIETMTRKTGNFKTFGVFTDMLRAVFLRTSPSVTMELLTQKDLERINERDGRSFEEFNSASGRRVYFIMIYTSEFDRIHYPIPLEYCGPPNPEILQATIQNLESDRCKLQKELEEFKNKSMQERCREIICMKKNMSDYAEQQILLEAKVKSMLDAMGEMQVQQRLSHEAIQKLIDELTYSFDCKIKELYKALPAKKGPPVKCCSCNNSSDGATARKLRSRSNSPGSSSACSIPPLNVTPRSTPGLPSGRPRRTPRSVFTTTAPPNQPKLLRRNNNIEKPVYSENEIDSLGKQIEALQKAIVGLSNNFNSSKA